MIVHLTINLESYKSLSFYSQYLSNSSMIKENILKSEKDRPSSIIYISNVLAVDLTRWCWSVRGFSSKNIFSTLLSFSFSFSSSFFILRRKTFKIQQLRTKEGFQRLLDQKRSTPFRWIHILKLKTIRI